MMKNLGRNFLLWLLALSFLSTGCTGGVIFGGDEESESKRPDNIRLVGPLDVIGKLDVVGPQERVFPLDIAGRMDVISPQDLVGPLDIVGPIDEVSKLDVVGRLDVVGPQERVVPLDVVGKLEVIDLSDVIGKLEVVGPVVLDKENIEEGYEVITKVTRPNGNVVKFIEGVGGTIIAVEEGKAPNRPLPILSDKSMNFVEIYSHLRPDKPVPERLKLLQDNMDANGFEQTKPKEQIELTTFPTVDRLMSIDHMGGFLPSPSSAIDALCPQDWFAENVHACYDPGNGWENRWYRRKDDYSYQKNDHHLVDTAHCVYRGYMQYKVQTRTWWSWTTVYSKWIDEGWYATVSTRPNWLGQDYDIKVQIIGATSEGWHHCSRLEM